MHKELIEKTREVAEVEIEKTREVAEVEIEKTREVAEVKIKAARAEAEEHCTDKFLLFAFAAEYEAWRQKTQLRKALGADDEQ